MSFSNKVVLVTGGSSGIGAATAVAFAKEGADVIIVGRNELKLQEVAADITKVGKPPLVIRADVTKHEDLKTIIKKTIGKYEKLDVLVNNAGCFRFARILDDNLPEMYDLILKTNLTSTVMLTHLAAPYLIKTKGNIVNVSSIASNVIMSEIGEGFASYCITKAGMDQFTRTAAFELASHGVRVNTVNPGPVHTSLLDASNSEFDWSSVQSLTALKTMTKSDEVANMIMYLASDKAVTVTGSHFKIDSGFTLK